MEARKEALAVTGGCWAQALTEMLMSSILHAAVGGTSLTGRYQKEEDMHTQPVSAGDLLVVFSLLPRSAISAISSAPPHLLF